MESNSRLSKPKLVVKKRLFRKIDVDCPDCKLCSTCQKARQWDLTIRELELLKLICKGESIKFIAKELNISTETVKTHTANIFEKVGCDNRTQLAVWAIESNIVPSCTSQRKEETESIPIRPFMTYRK